MKHALQCKGYGKAFGQAEERLIGTKNGTAYLPDLPSLFLCQWFFLQGLHLPPDAFLPPAEWQHVDHKMMHQKPEKGLQHQ